MERKMGLAVPRPAMRAKESRVITARLKRYDELLKELIASGMDKDAASKQAYKQAINENPYKK